VRGLGVREQTKFGMGHSLVSKLRRESPVAPKAAEVEMTLKRR
jgi:hypothetical protein